MVHVGRSAREEAVSVEESDQIVGASDWDQDRVVRLSALSNSCHRVRELRRPLGEYMALPASQYSVLDARRVERINEDTFVCYVGHVQFFQFNVEPVLTLRVVVVPMGCEIHLLSCRIAGSKFVEDQNQKFSTTMKNKYARHTHGPARRHDSLTCIGGGG